MLGKTYTLSEKFQTVKPLSLKSLLEQKKLKLSNAQKVCESYTLGCSFFRKREVLACA
jgi:hypothetical protein